MASPSPQVGTDAPDMRMSERIRAFDWASTLGPMRSWPEELRSAFNILEHSAFPTAIYWGPELRLLYNDSWAPFLAERHPLALGQPAKRVWADIWPLIEPRFDQVLNRGESVYQPAEMLPLVRDGVPQETFWYYGLSPIFDGAGKVAGVFNQANEITRAVINERRLSFQVMVADRLRTISDPEGLKVAAAAMLGEYLGAARVGFADVDEGADRLEIAGDWTRGEALPSLSGQTGRLSELPKAAIAYLRQGEVLAISDVHNLTQGSSEQDAELGTRLGVKAVITVPLIRGGKIRALLYVHEPHVREWKRSDAAMARDVAERSWAAVERAETEQRLRESEDHYRHTVELNPQVTWTALPDGQLNRVAKRWEDWTGTPGTGESWAGGLHPEDVERTFAVWRRCVETGEPYDIEHRVKMLDGRYRWARSRAFPRRDGEGAICLWYGSTEDIHEQKVAEERQRLLINELNHRVKNTLATVQAIAFQTFKGDMPIEEARAQFEARLLALSRAHNLLTEQNWEGAPLERVVRDSTEHMAPERFDISGEPVFLEPRAALALALALHELGTNAAKYGALAGDAGRISIDWALTPTTLRLVWKERDGPAVRSPGARGFGSRLIERGLATDLAGSAELQFEPDGVRCTIDASREAVRLEGGARG